MKFDLDIHRSPNVLIRKHADDAVRKVAMGEIAILERGDKEAQAFSRNPNQTYPTPRSEGAFSI